MVLFVPALASETASGSAAARARIPGATSSGLLRLRSENRILTTHVGSLIRPAALLERADARAGPEQAALLRRAVEETVLRQVETGLDVLNDGELGQFRRAADIPDRTSG